jgi:tripartite-type tricarboxylate transporter receptor subunit TctC
MEDNVRKLRVIVGRIAPAILGAAVMLVTSAGLTRQQATAAEFDAEKYFKGKTITLVVDQKAGGGTDIEARYFAGNWGKFIPGKPRVIVTNLIPLPAGKNYVWKSAPDGLTLDFLPSPGVGTETSDPNAKFTSQAEFTYIGSHNKRDVSLITSGKMPFNTLKDAKGSKTPLTIAESMDSVEDVDGKLLGTLMLANWFDVPVKIANVARSGTADALVLIERGDVNTFIGGSNWYTLTKMRPGWFKNGFVKVIADLSHPDAPSIPNSEISMPVPNVVQWLTPEQRALWEGIYLPEVLFGKAIIGPPKMAPEVTKALRDSYGAAVQDPEFAAGLNKILGIPLAYLPGEKVQQMMIDSTVAFNKYQPQYKKIQKEVYDRYIK